jgi:hypothetical protein
MAFKTTYSQYDNTVGLISTEGPLDLTTIPSNENKITASDGVASDRFGNSVAVGNSRIVVGAYFDDDNDGNSGSAYIFDLDGTQLAKITASDGASGDNFGKSVAIGNGRIVVGANGDDDNASNSGSAYIFDLAGTQLAKITASDGADSNQFGYSVAVGNGRIVVGALYDDDNGSNSGSAYIFNLDGTQLAKITASDGAANDNFGYSVAVGNGRIVVGAYNDTVDGSTGSAYIFDLAGTQLAKITASDGAANDNFGTSVAIGSARIVVGASGDYDNRSTGSAYIFDLDGTQLAKITASDGADSDNFGNSVAVGNSRIVVGAYFDDEAGDASDSGSVYIFDLDGTQLAKITASDGAAGDWFGNSVAIGNGRIVVAAQNDTVDGNYQQGSAYIYETPNIKDYFDILE